MRDLSFDWPSPLDPPSLLTQVSSEQPVLRVRMPSGDQGYLVTRHDDVVRVLMDPVFSRAWLFRPGVPQYSERPIGLPESLLNLDPPDHTRLRRAVSRAFVPRRVESMRADVQDIAEGLLDRMEAGGGPTAAANRDEAAFPEPARMDLDRAKNDHLTFGRGAHFCLGAGIARMELQTGLAALLCRFPGLRLAVDPAELRWRSGMAAFGPHELPVAW
ncbi:cytochrome P450 [Nonomuraea sp. NPDC049400]|uniref:cytochrome P450 n=1 Tax=Nonomuraea sp. NPDC049400 TaxID=3364352 RepID=UPI0037B1C35D